MTLLAAKVGGWALNDLLLSTEMTFLQNEYLKAVDGAGGGTYNLTAPLTFDGNEVRIDFTFRVRSGADMFIDSGAQFGVSAGGTFDVNGTYTFDGTGAFRNDVDFEATSTVTFFDLDELVVDDHLAVYRLNLTAAQVNENGGADTWNFVGTAGWVQQTLSSSALVSFPLPVLEGDTIESVSVTFDGAAGHGGVLPTTVPRIRLLEGPTFVGTWLSIASVDDPATIAFYEGGHTFLMDNASTGGALPYVALNRPYRIEIRGENGGSAVTGLELGQISASITRRKLVSTNIL